VEFITVQSIQDIAGKPVAITYRAYTGATTPSGIQHMIIADAGSAVAAGTPPQLRVFSYANANPMAVRAVDGTGTPLSVFSVAGNVIASVTGQLTVTASITGVPTWQGSVYVTQVGSWRDFIVGGANGLPAGVSSFGGDGHLLRVDLVRGSAGDGRLQDRTDIAIMASVRSYASGPYPLTIQHVSSGGLLAEVSSRVGGGALRVDPQIGIVDPGNSTVAALGIGATFTGSHFDLKDYAGGVLYLFADRPSATNGIRLEYSADGSNFDYVLATTLAGSGAVTFNVLPHGRHFRLVYTNGTSAQGAFRAQFLAKPVGFQFGGLAVTQAGSWDVGAVGGTSSVWTTPTSKAMYGPAKIGGAAGPTFPFSMSVASLANNAGRQSRPIDNYPPQQFGAGSGGMYEDALVQLTVRIGSPGVSSLGTVELYAYGGTGVVFTDVATETDAPFFAVNAPLLGVFTANSNTMLISVGPIAVAPAFGGRLPIRWGVALVNKTGVPLDGTEIQHTKQWIGVWPWDT
jgi:hypothetical protein